jgi:hypothetical protein
MKRKCRKFRLDQFFKQFPELSERNIELWIDDKNKDEIFQILFEKNKNGKYIRENRFKSILLQIFNYRYSKELYDKEEVSSKAKNITAMKFKNQFGANWRIYCKEFHDGEKRIIMIVARNKKTQNVNSTLKVLLETIGEYEYDFEDEKL